MSTIHPNLSAAGPCDELLPWADPYIAQLARAHRHLQAALNDSVQFVRKQAQQRRQEEQSPSVREWQI